MSDYCKQCSEKIFRQDFGDMKGITKPEDWAKDMAACVICEGCGHIQVDPEGNCITKDCLRRGHKNEK